MSEDKIEKLLKTADQYAGPPEPVDVNINNIRRRAKRNSLYKTTVRLAAAAAILIAAGIWKFYIPTNQTTESLPIASTSFEEQLAQVQQSTRDTINMIQDILEQQQRQRRLDELEAELAAIPDPLEDIRKEVDKTAFILVYSAERMYRELNLTDSAVETYKRVIELFPDNRWAQVAREHLEEIEKNQINNNRSEGDLKWKLQNTLS